MAMFLYNGIIGTVPDVLESVEEAITVQIFWNALTIHFTLTAPWQVTKNIRTSWVHTEDSSEHFRARAGAFTPFITTRPRRCFGCWHLVQSTKSVAVPKPISPSWSAASKGLSSGKSIPLLTGSRLEAPPAPPEVRRRRPPRTRRQRTAPATPIRMRTSATPEAHEATTTTIDIGTVLATRGAERPNNCHNIQTWRTEWLTDSFNNIQQTYVRLIIELISEIIANSTNVWLTFLTYRFIRFYSHSPRRLPIRWFWTITSRFFVVGNGVRIISQRGGLKLPSPSRVIY